MKQKILLSCVSNRKTNWHQFESLRRLSFARFSLTARGLYKHSNFKIEFSHRLKYLKCMHVLFYFFVALLSLMLFYVVELK